jgi:uncharacterized membrane protein YfcA
LFFSTLLAGACVGLVGGVTAGLLGVSPGGGLVIFSVLLLGAEQHVAQGVSLIAQIFPTSLSGIRRYREKGAGIPLRWATLLAIGFVAGGVGGALAAAKVSAVFLQWTYVLYLTALDALMIFRGRKKPEEASSVGDAQIHWVALIGVGAFAGFSSGFIGIGGGLAVTVGLAALKAPQRQAQLMSLVLAILPTTIPAAYLYWRQGWSAPWPVLVAAIVGLWIGTDLGARAANKVSETALHRLLIGFVSAMALYMTYKALS